MLKNLKINWKKSIVTFTKNGEKGTVDIYETIKGQYSWKTRDVLLDADDISQIIDLIEEEQGN